ncbi:MAG: DUF1579 domain-containing protein [Isosphaeraceae bacterium]
MRRRPGRCVVAIGLLLSAGAAARAQEGFELPKPTDEHKLLRSEVGTWEATIKSWMDPKAEPLESKGTETNRLLPGGLFIISQFRGDFGGQPFHGHGTTGYDTHKKKYVGTWIDSMSTGIMAMEGTYDPATKTLTMTGESRGPDGSLAQIKTEGVHKSADSRVFTMFMKPMGAPDWVKMMEISYKKVATPAAVKKAVKP